MKKIKNVKKNSFDESNVYLAKEEKVDEEEDESENQDKQGNWIAI